MSLSMEWNRRIKLYMDTLFQQRIRREIGTFEVEGFVTRERLTPAQAARRAFKPMPVGTRWGEAWDYGWFRAAITLPDTAAGQWVYASTPQGRESYVLVNGKLNIEQGRIQRMIELSRQAKAGARYEILLEAYAGHGPTPCHIALARHGQEPWNDPEGAQATVQRSTIELWNEAAFQVWLDMNTLWELREKLTADDAQQAEIDRALCDVTVLLDLEAPDRVLEAGLAQARRRLAPVLARRNGTVAPQYTCFGHAHLDVSWLWGIEETIRKMVRTMANTAALSREYPEYRYLQSQPHLFWLLKRHYPEFYAQMRQLVKKGHVIPDGAMWVEPDMNISGGEALIRQCLMGKRFFREEFGVESRLLWLPDVFGYSAALPQILRGCGVDWFTTAKLYWAYNGGEPFPLTEFQWEGIDGTTVLTHLHRNYNSRTSPGELIARWRQNPQKDGVTQFLLPFGWGDGGGGPERQHLEYLRRTADLQGVPRTRIGSPAGFFEALEKRGVTARYVGELYFQAHRGVLTTQARTKRGNRRCELALRETELWATLASARKGFAFDARSLDDAWRDLLLNQFHDILPGSSIGRVYEEALARYDRIEAVAGEVRRAATGAFARRGAAGRDGMIVYNSLSWPRRVLVEAPPGVRPAVPTQRVEGRVLTEVSVPACGWTSVKSGAAAPTGRNRLRATPTLIENEHLRLKLDQAGEIVSLLDLATGRDWAAGPCNSLRLFKDTPVQFEAWDIDTSYKRMPVALPRQADIRVVAKGPLVAIVRVARKLGRSTLEQDIILRRDSRRVEFRTTVDWRERHRLLKVAFPVSIHADHALHEIQFGHVQRPNHASRPYDADRYEVSQHKWSALMEAGRGAAILNDCKYGLNVEGNTIALTLLRAPTAPDRQADVGTQTFTYAFYAWNGAFHQSDLIREAYELNVPAWSAPGQAGETAWFAVDAPGVVIEAVKPAEDGSGDVVVRLYEATRTATRAILRTALPVVAARATNMLEQAGVALPLHQGALALDFRPFEIKTVRLRLAAR